MAQALYDSSPTRSLRQYNGNAELSSYVPDIMMSASAKPSQVNYNMSQNRSAPKKRLSRLELLRSDYSKKLQIEREEKINKLKVIQQENSLKQDGSGIVREFFAERRALEATRKGQKNPELLPPIESHFKKVKGQKQDTHLVKNEQLSKTNLSAGKRISLKQEPPLQKTLPSKYSTRTQTRNIGVNIRKRTKGIDKLDPLPPLSKGGSDVARRKPPTPNKRYETHSVLMQDDGDNVESTGPFMPIPPIERKPKRSKVPLPPPSGEESILSDYEDAQSTLTDYSSVAPNLSKLKAKALKQRQLSKQKLFTTNQPQDNGKLTDFQKWQMDQDSERAERLEKHKQKSELSLSQRENDILNQIQEEQSRLERLKQQRKELDEQEKRQKEEDEKWLDQKRTLEEQDILPQHHFAQEAKPTKKTISKKPPKSHKQPAKEDRAIPTQAQEDDQSENIHDNAYSNFYDEQTKGVDEVVLDVSPCSICGRNFASERLAKHEKVCEKNSNSKRKVYNTRQHRSEGTEFENYVQSGKHLEEPKKKVTFFTRTTGILNYFLHHAVSIMADGWRPTPRDYQL